MVQQLGAPTLTIVSNACGALWNFSARCREDQETLRRLDAVAKLTSLVDSKHEAIAKCSAAALKNLRR